MKRVQITIDKTLLAQIAVAAAELNVSRSTFIRNAVRQVLWQNHMAQFERQEAEAFARIPMPLNEVLVWQSKQVWDDEGELVMSGE